MSAAGFRKMLARTGKEAKFRFLVHPHMLRHACGSKLANDGQDTRALQHYLGHKNIQHTVRYTELTSCGRVLLGVSLSANDPKRTVARVIKGREPFSHEQGTRSSAARASRVPAIVLEPCRFERCVFDLTMCSYNVTVIGRAGNLPWTSRLGC
jgi:hypothetical protein